MAYEAAQELAIVEPTRTKPPNTPRKRGSFTLLSAGDLRDAVAKPDQARVYSLQICGHEWVLAITLLHSLTGGVITDANCADTPMHFVAEIAA